MAESTIMLGATTTTIELIPTCTQLTAMFSHLLATKLDNVNLLQWRQLIMVAIRGNRIDSFV